MRKELLFNEFAEELFEKIDITPTDYATAVNRYEAVGNYLISCKIDTYVYPQGSFRIGTVVRPFKKGEDADFDIDLVCQLKGDKNTWEPQLLKHTVFDLLSSSEVYKKLLDQKEGRRCWRLNYCEANGFGFHLDILPSIKELESIIKQIIENGINWEFAHTAIAISDMDKEKKTYKWSSGNANGFASWFEQINKPFLDVVSDVQKRKLVEKRFYKTIDEVPNIQLRSSLQRVIQLLKRHRDCRFGELFDADDKPISIIITVLAANIAFNCKQYNASIEELLNIIIESLLKMSVLLTPNYINESEKIPTNLISRDSDGKWYIKNPIDPLENYSDKWDENNNKKAKAFFKWVSLFNEDVLIPIKNKDSGKSFQSLSKGFGNSVVSLIYEKLDLNPKENPTLITNQSLSPKPWLKING